MRPAPPSAGDFDGGASFSKRAIPANYPYDPKALKPLARTLWSASVALGHALTAYRQFTRIKSGSISPDGKVGGMGYIQSVEEVRKRLFQACELLSSVSDSLDDEIRAPHWKPRLGTLTEDDAEDIERLMDDASRIMDDPSSEAEEDLESFEDENNLDSSEQEEEEEGTPPKKQASSAFPVQQLGGPRVDNRSPGSGEGPAGSYNEDDWTEDSWPLGPRVNIASSGMPSGVGDRPSVGYDFGLGYGARGQGVQYGPRTPWEGQYGVHGDHSFLPQDITKPSATSDLSADPQNGVEPHASGLPGVDVAPRGYDRGLPNFSESEVNQNTDYRPRPSSPFDYDMRRKQLPMAPQDTISDFFSTTGSVSEDMGLLDLSWLRVDPEEYAKTEILPRQNLDMAPDLAALWAHEDKSAVTYLLPNKADLPKTMADLSEAHGKVSKEAVVRAARLLVTQTTDIKAIQEGLFSRFPREHLVACRSELSKVFAERGLLGPLYIAAEDFPKCSSNDTKSTSFVLRHARHARFVVAKSQCSGCVHGRGGFCAVFHKELVPIVPYTTDLADEIEAEKKAAGKKIASIPGSSPKDRIRSAILASDVIVDKIQPVYVENTERLMPPVQEYEPVKLAPVLATERSMVMDLVTWMHGQKRLTAAEVREAAFAVSTASSKEELASLVASLDQLQPIQDASYSGSAYQVPRPNVTKEAILSGLQQAGDLLKKRNAEAQRAVAEQKARPILALIKRELLKGHGFEAVKNAIHLSVDPRDLVDTREIWYPVLSKAGFLGTLYTEQSLFASCQDGVSFLNKYASPVRYVVAGPKCQDCSYNKVGRCALYRRPLVASEEEILTPEVVDRSISNLVAAGKASVGELDSLRSLPPREALKEIYRVAHSHQRSAWDSPTQRTTVETAWVGMSSPTHDTSEYLRANIVTACRKYMNEGLYGRELGYALRKTFDPRDLQAVKEDLRPLVAEQGLQGIFYVDPTVYSDYGKGCDEPSRLFRASNVPYLKVGSACRDCIHQKVPGECSKISKKLVVEPPYHNKEAQRKQVLASGSSMVVPPENLVNYGANMIAEYQLQNHMDVEYAPEPSTSPLDVSFGEDGGIVL